ncbi:MAG: putative peptidoglycan-binding domain-containing protein, partial [Elusimicrobiota bacterium]|nr:hypothetical protein [Endomicrobiia bacterium]MDW8166711.1 putative peptidoglycan-binding domain-containing protein [Elusimicrobiota bacterium]
MHPGFERHFQRVIQLEGGFSLHRNPTEEADTYAGIYRKAFPKWHGWEYIDRGEIPPTELVRKHYYEQFYRHLEGIKNERIRFIIFEFAVNAGLKKAIKIAQVVVGVVPDGVLGPKTLGALNSYSEELFIAHYSLARIKHYLDIVNRDPK